MFIQYGSVLCISCASSMRLATIEPDQADTSTVTFECRYLPCAQSRVMVLGRSPLKQDVRSSSRRSMKRRTWNQRRRVR
jgi:hypothetical protein